jgi:hypothetical protein
VLASRFAGPSTEDFLHKSLGMLNARLRELLQAYACCAFALLAAIAEKQNTAKTLAPSAFLPNQKISRASLRNRAVHVVAHSACASRDARCGVGACSLALHRAKTLVFLPRCSNPNAVLAIPAGTGRYRHSLTARRAAWRRSEGRRRRQRKRARRRPSAGRRSKRAPRISLRLRTTSMTASNGPARVEQR